MGLNRPDLRAIAPRWEQILENGEGRWRQPCNSSEKVPLWSFDVAPSASCSTAMTSDRSNRTRRSRCQSSQVTVRYRSRQVATPAEHVPSTRPTGRSSTSLLRRPDLAPLPVVHRQARLGTHTQAPVTRSNAVAPVPTTSASRSSGIPASCVPNGGRSRGPSLPSEPAPITDLASPSIPFTSTRDPARIATSPGRDSAARRSMRGDTSGRDHIGVRWRGDRAGWQ